MAAHVVPRKASWYHRPNPEDLINRKPGDRKNDQRTEKAKKHETKDYCLESNIWSNLYLVNLDMLISGYTKPIILSSNVVLFGPFILILGHMVFIYLVDRFRSYVLVSGKVVENHLSNLSDKSRFNLGQT